MNTSERKIIRILIELLQLSLSTTGAKKKNLRQKKESQSEVPYQAQSKRPVRKEVPAIQPRRDSGGRFCSLSKTTSTQNNGLQLKLKNSSITIRATVGW